MKKLFVLISCLILAVTLWAQSDIPEFGKVDKADLEMKECDFDKNAEAVVLFDVGELSCEILQSGVVMNLQRHVRIKILKEKGMSLADIHILFSRYSYEVVKGIEAQTYNLDAAGNITVSKLDKKTIFEKKLNKRLSDNSFVLPEVKAGSIIEYKYNVLNIGLANWSFQKSVPVKYSRYSINFPKEIEIRVSPFCVLPYETKDEQKYVTYIKTLSMQNVPALRDESFISCEDDYLQRIELQATAIITENGRKNIVPSWGAIVALLLDDIDFGSQLKVNIPQTADLDALLKNEKDPYRKMVIIHDYVRKNMAWNGYDNIWALDGVKSAWKNKKGTSGEINLVLINLLKDAKLTVNPILISTRDNGKIYMLRPNTRQFNKVMAYVIIGNRSYILDATEKYTPARLIPSDIMLTKGLIMDKENQVYDWHDIWNKDCMYKEDVLLNAVIDENGQLKGNATVTSSDYSRVARMPELKKGKDKFLEKYFTLPVQGIKPDSLVIENEDSDSLPLVQKLQFSMPVSSSGDYKYFSANLFTGLEKNNFVADNRFSDVVFGASQHFEIICNVTIPAGYVFEALPQNTKMTLPDNSITFVRIMSAQKNQLAISMKLDFAKPLYEVNQYPQFKEFYKKLFGMLNEQIAIRKEK